MKVAAVIAGHGLKEDGVQAHNDEEDAGTDGGDDGHDEGGDDETLVGAPGPTDGEPAGGEEDDGGPDAGGIWRPLVEGGGGRAGFGCEQIWKEEMGW